jgi:hypothetical protein
MFPSWKRITPSVKLPEVVILRSWFVFVMVSGDDVIFSVAPVGLMDSTVMEFVIDVSAMPVGLIYLNVATVLSVTFPVIFTVSTLVTIAYCPFEVMDCELSVIRTVYSMLLPGRLWASLSVVYPSLRILFIVNR